MAAPLAALAKPLIASAASSLVAGEKKPDLTLGTTGQKRTGAGLLGAGQLISSIVKRKKADELKPPLEDVNQRTLLSDIQRRRKAIQTGAEFEAGIREQEQIGATTQSNIRKVTGGDVGGTVSGLLKTQRGVGRNINRLLAQEAGRRDFFTNLETSLTNRMSDRKLALQQFERTQALAEAARLRQDAMSNLLGLSATQDPVGVNLPSRKNPVTGEEMPDEGSPLGDNIIANPQNFG